MGDGGRWMAQIRRLYWGAPVGNPHPTAVDAELRAVRAPDGDVLLQMSTYGSADRVSPPKVSQTIQLDRRSAIELRHAIDELFPSSEKSCDGP